MLKCCILIFFHFLVVTKQRDPDSGQHSLLFQVKRICDKPIYNIASKVMPISACSITLWMHADDAVKLKSDKIMS